jgi:nicotinate-nucleotide--dimethylbenzimidazole phosphoribosyltransferase
VTWFHTALTRLPGPDGAASAAVRARADDVLRPRGALARLDAIAVHMAAWQRTTTPRVERPACLVFAADHGVAANAEVSAYPTGVTAAMLAACEQGRATISALSRSVGATVDTLDVGVGRPTGDIRVEPAMSPERFAETVDAAVAAVDALDTDLLVVGEIGIGNTTVAAALAGALLGGDPGTWVGRGSGVDDAGLARKQDAVAAVQRRLAGTCDEADPIEVMRQAGGAELTAIAAATVAARLRSIPVVLDGYIVTSAVLPLHVAAPGSLDHCLVGHCSAEPGHRRVLETIGQKAVLDLGMRLGEASGAMAAVPIIRASCAAVVDVATFSEWFGPDAS